MRQFDREIAAPLLRLPAADPAFGLAENAQKRRQPVIPVVISRDGEDVAPALLPPARALKGVDKAALIIVGGGDRIDLIAAENEQLSRRELQRVVRGSAGGRLGLGLGDGLHGRRTVASQPEAVAPDEPGDGKSRVPAVARVRDVVDPQFALVCVIRRRQLRGGIERGDEFASGGHRSDHRRSDNLQARVEELPRIEPADARHLADRNFFRFIIGRHR